MSISSLIETLKKRMSVEDIRFCFEYGEKGYWLEQGKTGILFADWNNISKADYDRLEKHFELEWIDEWLISGKSKAYRCSGDSYSWVPYYWICNGGVIGGDEIEADKELAEEYIQTELVNNPKKANVFDIDLEDFEFEPYNGKFENGLHRGMNDDPEEIYEELREKYPDSDIVFDLTGTAQFSTEFAVYVRRYNRGLVDRFEELVEENSVGRVVGTMVADGLFTKQEEEEIDKIFFCDSSNSDYSNILDYLEQIERT